MAIWLAHDPACQLITGNACADKLLMQGTRGGNISCSAPAADREFAYKPMRDGVELRAEDLPAQRAAAAGEPVRDFEMQVMFPNGESAWV